MGGHSPVALAANEPYTLSSSVAPPGDQAYATRFDGDVVLAHGASEGGARGVWALRFARGVGKVTMRK